MNLRRLMSEIHRRAVWQVLGSYAVLAWALLQLSAMLVDRVTVPAWFGPASTIVVFLGFPVLLITTLIQGGFKKGEFVPSRFRDSAEGGDESLSSWKSLESSPIRDSLRFWFTWRKAVAGGILMVVLLVIGVLL